MSVRDLLGDNYLKKTPPAPNPITIPEQDIEETLINEGAELHKTIYKAKDRLKQIDLELHKIRLARERLNASE